MATNNSLNINAVTPLILAWGGTNASLTADDGAMVYSDASKLQLLAATATASQIILSGSNTAPSWSTATYLGAMTANEILYASSSNVMGQIATAANGVLITNNSSVPSLLANSGTPGYVLTANTGAPPSWQAITGSVTWSSIAGTTQTAAVNHGYIVSNIGQTTITLPATAALGSVVEVAGLGAGGWILEPGAGQDINLGEDNATVSITSANANDCIRVVCVVADTSWTMLSSVGAGFTYV